MSMARPDAIRVSAVRRRDLDRPNRKRGHPGLICGQQRKEWISSPKPRHGRLRPLGDEGDAVAVRSGDKTRSHVVAEKRNTAHLQAEYSPGGELVCGCGGTNGGGLCAV